MLREGCLVAGKYRILGVLGKGGMSTVYLTVDERVNCRWAIKEIVGEEVRQRSLERQELELMKRLQHPNLPRIVDVIEEREALLIVMDYIEGETLESILKKEGRQPEEKVLLWAKQLCDVLGYLHSREPPVIYRDMKPSNVMLRSDGTVVLIDLGAAREFKPENLQDTVSLGTQGYAAPEQYEKAGQSDARTDIYSLGVMLFQLLTNENPHGLRPIREIHPAFSPGLETIIQVCTKIEKEKRYQSCQELFYALEHYQELGWEYQRKQKRRWYFFLCLLLLTTGFLAGSWLFALLGIYEKKHNYESYLQAAQNAPGKEEAVENYRKAIALSPFREEAYLGLLEDAFLEDQVLDIGESEVLRQVLIDYGKGGKTNERVFQKNKAGYARFSYAAGIAYFYKFTDQENKKLAKGYCETAASSSYLTEAQCRRAERLSLIAGYYSEIGRVDAAGDSFVSYRQYWEDLLALSEGNLVAEDNERTALLLYQELAGQLISHTIDFRMAGVEEKEMTEKLASIRKHLQKDFENLDKSRKAAIETETANVEKMLRQAQKRVRSVYGKEESE